MTTQDADRTVVTVDPALYFNFVGECLGQANVIPNNPGHIYFGVAAGKEIPADILAILDRIENTAVVIRELYQQSKPDKFGQLFRSLVSAAQLLAGPKPSPLAAAAAVGQLRESVVLQEGKRIKTSYLNELGAKIVRIVALVVLLTIAANLEAIAPLFSSQILSFIPYYAATACSATIAMWLSFASRKTLLSFEDLLEPGGDMMGPWHRIAYVNLFTAILAVFCAADVAGVSVGNFSTTTISTSYISAIIFGFVCGFSEKLLASTVAPHVTQIVGGLGKTRNGAPTI